MAQETSVERQAFQRQPARAVLIDLSPPMSVESCLNIQQALTNTLTLLHHMSTGPSRVPFIGLFVLGNYPECIYPLQPLKGNFVRMTVALKEIISLSQNIIDRQCNPIGCIFEGLQEALAQFHRLTHNYKQGPGSGCFPAQIDLTLVTSQSTSSVRNLVEKFAHQLNLEHLKKISSVCVSDPERLISVQYEGRAATEGEKSLGLSQLNSSPTELGLSMLDLVSIENDVLSLQNVFQGWLLDCSTDSEALHLTLPHIIRHGDEERGDECLLASHDNSFLTIKCDLHEILLDPTLIGTLGQHFTINLSLPPKPMSRGSASSILGPANLPIYKLIATELVAADGICESVVFGLPHILRPTTCWKLDWEDLEINQQRFNALCRLLRDKNHVLVARVETTSPSLSPHFLMFPSSSQTLLIKSVAVSELMLPIDMSASIEQTDNDIPQTIACSLDKLEVQDTYNPMLTQSGLYETLSVTKKSNLSKQPAKSIFEPTPSSNRGRATGKGTAGRLGTVGRRNQKKGLGFQ